MGTVIQDQQQHNHDSQPRWDRFERADLFEQYSDLQAQGVSQRQAAQQLQVPRTTLQAWHRWHDTLDSCPEVAQCFQSGPGLAFLHRLVMAFHIVCVAVGACGMRLACLFRNLTRLDRFVAASYGAQQQVNRQVEAAIADYRQTETARWAKDMPRTDITLTQDDTLTGGLCLVGMEPKSHDMVLEQLAAARDQDPWHALMEPALAGLNGQVRPSTSDEAPGLLASVEHHLGAHHSPDLFPVQPERSKAVSAPLAVKERAAHQALWTAQETLEQAPGRQGNTAGEPAKRGPGRPPKVAVSLEQAEQAVELARQEHQRLFEQRQQAQPCMQAIGHAYHCVDLDRGVRRNGKRMASDIHDQIDTMRTVAHQEGLSPSALERIEQAERVVPKMQATMAFVSGDVRQQVTQLDVMPPQSSAMHAHRIPSCSLERVARARTVTQGEPLRELAARLRPPLFASGGVCAELSPVEQNQIKSQAAQLADVFQRSSSNGEGRNGYLSLRNHQLQGLDCPRKRACLTAMHNFFLTRPDGTTAAERFFGQKPRSMFATILEAVELPPAPLSPPRKALG